MSPSTATALRLPEDSSPLLILSCSGRHQRPGSTRYPRQGKDGEEGKCERSRNDGALHAMQTPTSGRKRGRNDPESSKHALSCPGNPGNSSGRRCDGGCRNAGNATNAATAGPDVDLQGETATLLTFLPSFTILCPLCFLQDPLSPFWDIAHHFPLSLSCFLSTFSTSHGVGAAWHFPSFCPLSLFAQSCPLFQLLLFSLAFSRPSFFVSSAVQVLLTLRPQPPLMPV